VQVSFACNKKAIAMITIAFCVAFSKSAEPHPRPLSKREGSVSGKKVDLIKEI